MVGPRGKPGGLMHRALRRWPSMRFGKESNYETVSDTTNGLDAKAAPEPGELLPQRAYVCRRQPAAGRPRLAPCEAGQVVSGHHLAPMLHEDRQQLYLTQRERDRRS